MNEHLLLYADGLCEPFNPGGVAAGGWRILDGETREELHTGYRVFCEGPEATNNVAEYGAMIAGLEWVADRAPELRERGFITLSVRGDSQLAIYQTAGKWNCNKPHLAKLRDQARAVLQRIKDAGFVCSLAWIPREENEEADALSRAAYREHLKQKAAAVQ